MDKTTFLVNQNVISYDLNSLAQDVEKGLGRAIEFILGTTAGFARGFTPSQTTVPSMSINIGPGQVYQYASIDANPIGTFNANVNQIVQQGWADAQTVALNAGGLTSGQSQYWLVQVQFQQSLITRPGDPTGGRRGFYNSANPASPLDGVNGLGGIIPTADMGVAQISAIAGVAGVSPTAPSPSAGCLPLYLILVGYGQTQITTGQITVHPTAPFLAGLVNQHHKGTQGQAPQIDLTTEVKNLLPYTNMFLSNQYPNPAGGNITQAGIIPIITIGSVNPNGNISGQVRDIYVWFSGTTYLYVCTTSGSATTAAWTAIGGGSTNNVTSYGTKYIPTPVSINFNVGTVTGTFYQCAVGSGGITGSLPPTPADGTVFKFIVVSGTGLLTLTANGSDTILNAGIQNTNLTLNAYGGSIELIAVSGGWQTT